MGVFAVAGALVAEFGPELVAAIVHSMVRAWLPSLQSEVLSGAIGCSARKPWHCRFAAVLCSLWPCTPHAPALLQVLRS